MFLQNITEIKRFMLVKHKKKATWVNISTIKNYQKDVGELYYLTVHEIFLVK